MKNILFNALGAFLLLFCLPLAAELKGSGEAEVHDDISIFLVTDKNEPTTVLPILKSSPNAEGTVEPDLVEAVFRYSLPKEFRNYDSWLLEIRDPKRNLSYRLSIDGQMPPVLSWDGVFGPDARVEPNSQYFYKLYLNFGEKTVASQWAVFSTFIKSPEDLKGIYGGLRLSVSSSGGTHGMVLMTNRFRPVLFPNLFGDIKVAYEDKHTVGIKFDATSNILFNASVNRTGFFYSDYSLFYRFRILGSAPRAAYIPPTPPYISSRYRASPSPSAFGKPTSLEVGARLFQTVLRGFGNEIIDPELAREFSGGAVHVAASQAIGPVRLHLLGEFGQSFFRGDITVMNFEGSITYDRFASVAPGLTARFSRFSGVPASDDYNGSPIGGIDSIENRLFFLGAIIHFKL